MTTKCIGTTKYGKQCSRKCINGVLCNYHISPSEPAIKALYTCNCLVDKTNKKCTRRVYNENDKCIYHKSDDYDIISIKFKNKSNNILESIPI